MPDTELRQLEPVLVVPDSAGLPFPLVGMRSYDRKSGLRREATPDRRHYLVKPCASGPIHLPGTPPVLTEEEYLLVTLGFPPDWPLGLTLARKWQGLWYPEILTPAGVEEYRQFMRGAAAHFRNMDELSPEALYGSHGPLSAEISRWCRELPIVPMKKADYDRFFTDELEHNLRLLREWDPRVLRRQRKDKSRGPGMRVKEANAKGMELARKMGTGFFAMSRRRQAVHIGCSFETWKKTPFYDVAETKRLGDRRRKPSSPKTESLTAAREAVTGEGDRNEVLEALIAEQVADREPSPLEGDPSGRPRKVRSHKRL